MRHIILFVFLLPILVMLAAVEVQADPDDDSLAAAEYFFDNDPGPGNGYPLAAADGAFDEPFESIAQTIVLPELISGPHYLFVRLRNVEGIWGIPRRHLFVVTNHNVIAAAEYFFDTDPGIGNAERLEITGNTLNAHLDVSGLVEGLHKVYIRMQDAEGSWGPARQHTFEVIGWAGSGAISAAEYFINSDPGEGNGTPLSPADGAFGGTTEDLYGQFRTNVLDEGNHNVYVRVRNANGQWTLPAPSKPLKINTFLGRIGDLNNDNQVDLKDAILALMVTSGQNPHALRTDYVSSGVDLDNWQAGLPEAIYILGKAAE